MQRALGMAGAMLAAVAVLLVVPALGFSPHVPLQVGCGTVVALLPAFWLPSLSLSPAAALLAAPAAATTPSTR
jgi:hypothetical protein